MSAAGGRDDFRATGPPSRKPAAMHGRVRQLSAAIARGPSWPFRSDVAGWFARQMAAETDARSGFFLAPAGLMAGIWLVYAIGVRPSIPVAGTVALIALFCAVRGIGHRMFGTACMFLGFASVGLAISSAELELVRTTTFSGEATARIEGTVRWRDRDERGRYRYLVEITRTERPVLSRPPERAQILVSSQHTPIGIGGVYEGLVRLRAPSGPALPGSYDFAFGSHFAGLGAYGFGLGPPEDRSAEPVVPTYGDRLLQLRLAAGERIRAAIGGPAGAVAAALMVGDRAGIPDDINLWLRTTGLSHVLSISGLHMALVAGFAMASVRALLAAIPWCALVLPIKKIAAVSAILVAGFYLVLSGSNVASDRSFVMLSIMLLAVLFDRPALTLRNVGIAAIVVLAMAPHALVTASFQMSFGATAALLAAYGAYARWKEGRGDLADRPGRGMFLASLLFLVGLGMSSLIAGTATAPFAAYHFQRVAPFGLLANMLALPLFSLWIMPLALISMVLMPLGLDGPFLVLMGHGLDLVFEIAHVLHDLLPDTPTGAMTREGLFLLSLALLLGCFLASRLRWIALPVALAGILAAPDRSLPPELLVFEDGREVALIDAAGMLSPLKSKPNDFVFSQWQRMFPEGTPSGPANDERRSFVCETLAMEDDRVTVSSADAALAASSASTTTPALGPTGVARSDAPPGNAPASSATTQTASTRKPRPPSRYCRATTRNGLKVVWTDDYRAAGRACDDADIAIVARAIRLSACRSGAMLVTLRTLRRTGSLSIRAEEGKPSVTAAIGVLPDEWNQHRIAPWPEAWRRVDQSSAPDTKGIDLRPMGPPISSE